MNLSLCLECDKGTVGIIRNPYERLITGYMQSLNYIGFDAWIHESKIPTQVSLYKDCDYLIRFEDWKNELDKLDLGEVDVSVLDGQKVYAHWKSWYTIRTITHVTEQYQEDITRFGYTL